MARIRSVKPEFWADRRMSRLSLTARFMYIGLWNLSDEHARGNGDTRYIKGQLFPYDDDVTPEVVGGLLDELEGEGRVVRYDVDGDPFLFLPNLGEHQRLEPSKVKSKYPAPPEMSEPQVGAESSEKISAGSEKKSALHVAGSMEHGAASDAAAAAELIRDKLKIPVPKSLLGHIEARLSEGWTVKALTDAVATETITNAASSGAVLTARIRDLGPPPKPKPRPGDEPECPDHPGQSVRNCRGCAADALTRPKEIPA